MNWNNELMFLALFVAMFVLTFCFTNYIHKVAQGRVWATGIWSLASFLLSAFVVFEYVRNPMALIPAGLGDFAGAVLAVRLRIARRKLLCRDCNEIGLRPVFNGSFLCCPNCLRAYSLQGRPLADDIYHSAVYLVGGAKLLPSRLLASEAAGAVHVAQAQVVPFTPLQRA